LSDLELRSAILLAILSFIIYPVLPTHAIDSWGLIEPQTMRMSQIQKTAAVYGFVHFEMASATGTPQVA
jgi:uncharacterized membrane protein (DUF4010 family)